jgi:hypothetical protein
MFRAGVPTRLDATLAPRSSSSLPAGRRRPTSAVQRDTKSYLMPGYKLEVLSRSLGRHAWRFGRDGMPPTAFHARRPRCRAAYRSATSFGPHAPRALMADVLELDAGEMHPTADGRLQIDQSSRSQAEKVYGWACPPQVAATGLLEVSRGSVASECGLRRQQIADHLRLRRAGPPKGTIREARRAPAGASSPPAPSSSTTGHTVPQRRKPPAHARNDGAAPAARARLSVATGGWNGRRSGSERRNPFARLTRSGSNPGRR